MASAASQKMSREDFRKQKELEEARKAGTAPAEVDEEGRDINPHIPQYISKAPWYLGMDKPTLKHQRPQAEKQQDSARIDEWFKRGAEAKEQVAATRYRKGACSNCGAMTHKRKDCLERPRRVGAKFTNKDIAPDEAAQPALQLDFDGKRDRWNGYDPREHQKVIDEYEKMEQIKRKIKEEQLAKEGENSQDKGLSSDDSSSDDDGERDEEKGYTETTAQPGTKVDTKRRITVRNLRIREDTAKYLRNLDLNSAYYDPKTRSMRSNPYAGTGKAPEDVNFVGDNFLRASGEVKEVAQQQLFAWDAADRGADIHLQADPTKAALMHKQHEAKRKEMKDKQKTSILEMYGGEKHLDAPPKELLLAQTEGYVEYSKFGNVIKGQEKAAVRSKYEEDVFPGNHTSVWGSHWRNGRWGYACCYSLERASYCTGEKGRDAVLAEGDKIAMLEKGGFAPSGHSDAAATTKKTLVELHREKQEADTKSKSGKAKKEKKKKKKKKRKHDSSSDDDDDEHETVIQKKMQEQKQAEAEAERLLQMDERDRPYNSSKRDFQDVTDDDMEAFRRKRQRADDPMANFM